MLIGSISSLMPSFFSAAAAKRRFSTIVARACSRLRRPAACRRGSSAAARRAPSHTRSRAPTPSRNSPTRSGRQAMPRSPASQLPAGRLCSTSFRLLSRKRLCRSPIEYGYGNRNSTASKPASAAAAKRSRNGDFVEQHRQVGGEFRHVVFLMVGQWLLSGCCRLARSVERADRGRRVFLAFREFLELVDRVDLGAHRDVGHALEDHLDHDRHAGTAAISASACLIAGAISSGLCTRIALQPRPSTTVTWSTP